MSDIENATQMRLNVRVTGELADYVQEQISSNGAYEGQGELVRDALRRLKEAQNAQDIELYKLVIESYNSPLSELETDFFDKKRVRLKELQSLKSAGKL